MDKLQFEKTKNGWTAKTAQGTAVMGEPGAFGEPPADYPWQYQEPGSTTSNLSQNDQARCQAVESALATIAEKITNAKGDLDALQTGKIDQNAARATGQKLSTSLMMAARELDQAIGSLREFGQN